MEYSCHVRDVLLAQRERVLLALVVDRPDFAPIFRDERAALARYNEDDPDGVVGELDVAAQLMARLYAGLSSAQLSRPCIYSYPTPAERSLAWVGHHTLHEGRHHLQDLGRVLADS